MNQILPRPVIPPEPDEPSGLGVFRWIVIGIIVAATFAGVLHWTMSVHRDRAEAVRMARPAEQLTCEGSPLIEFSGKDVVVNRKWSPLAGRHPSVTFTCRLSPALPPAKFVILCYRPFGTGEWITAETHPRRANSCRLTMHDLLRDMPYECFFIACSNDTTIQSNRIIFNTGQPEKH